MCYINSAVVSKQALRQERGERGLYPDGRPLLPIPSHTGPTRARLQRARKLAPTCVAPSSYLPPFLPRLENELGSERQQTRIVKRLKAFETPLMVFPFYLLLRAISLTFLYCTFLCSLASSTTTTFSFLDRDTRL